MNFPSFLSGFSPGLNVSEAATAIQQDAEDTQEKLSMLTALFIEMSDPDVLLTDLIDSVADQMGTRFSAILNDGDVINFEISDHNLFAKVGNTLTALTANGKVIETAFMNEVIPTITGAFHWSGSEIAASLAEQLQSTTVVSRLASLCQGATVTISDLTSVLSDVGNVVSPEVSNLINNLKSHAGSLNPTSLLGTLKSIYGGLAGATATDDTIEFDQTDWSMKSFCGTVIAGLFSTAVQALGTVLAGAGSVVAKIFGIAISVLGSIIPAIGQAAQSAELATYNSEAQQTEFSVPVWQGYVNVTDTNVDVRDYIQLHRIAKFTMPGISFYAWYNSSDPNRFSCAVYLNLLQNFGFDTKVYANALDVSPVYVTTSVSGNQLRVNFFTRPFDDYSTTYDAGRCPIAKGFGYIQSPDITPDPSTALTMNGESDEDLRCLVTKAICFLYYMQYSYERVGNDPDHATEQLIGYWYFNDCTTLKQASDALATQTKTYVYPTDMWFDGLLLSYNGHGLSWDVIIKQFIPAISSRMTYHPAVEYMTFPQAILGTTRSARFSASFAGSLIPVRSFRGSYLVVPPKYAQGSVTRALFTALIAVAVVAIAAVTVRAIAKVKIRNRMVDKYTDIQRKWETLKGMNANSPGYEAARKDYLKSVRKYNFIARLTGYSTLSTVQGWESGDTQAIGSGALSNLPTDQLVSIITGDSADLESNGFMTLSKLYTQTSNTETTITGLIGQLAGAVSLLTEKVNTLQSSLTSTTNSLVQLISGELPQQ